MNKTTPLLAELATVRELRRALEVVGKLEKHHGFKWRALGDRENNYGLVNIGCDPGYALVERVTNAIDAVIEREALRFLAKKVDELPASPREAVETWLGVPAGRVANLPLKTRQQLAEEIVITLFEGKSKRTPTIEIRDFGVGLTPDQMPKTILSLGEGNKIDKLYLAGAYGQGGSTVLAFCPEGSIFASRRHPDLLGKKEEDAISVTFARYNELDVRKNKNGRYEYLVDSHDMVPGIESGVLTDFKPGTSVIHFNLEIAQYSERLTQLTRSIWWLLQNALFDPVLPLWAQERRASVLKKATPDRRTIAGNYTRLHDDSRERIEYQDSVDVNVEFDHQESIVKVNYWVVRSKQEGSQQPIDAYVDPYRPIAYTYFGQLHGTDERRFVAERLHLPYLAKFMIIQVELDHLHPRPRRAILSTTRDRLKQVPFFETMRERVCQALSEDENLVRLNDERKEQILARHSDKERERMKQRFARLMERFHSGIDAAAGGSAGTKEGRKPSGSRSRDPLHPLPTKEEPTFIRIANTQRPIPVRLDRHALMRLESDAPNGYVRQHLHARLHIACQPKDLLVLESKSDFQGGRARVTVRTTESAKPDQTGSITVFLFTPTDVTLSDEVKFKIQEPLDTTPSGGAGKRQVKVPEPIPVRREQWADLGWNERSVAEVREDTEGAKIYVNLDNEHIDRLVRAGNYQEQGVKRMQNNYLLYTAFYSWVQHQFLSQKTDLALEGKEFEDYKTEELDRVAQTVVHSISAVGRTSEEE